MCSDYSQREKSGRFTTQNQKFHLLPDDDYLSPVILSFNKQLHWPVACIQVAALCCNNQFIGILEKGSLKGTVGIV
jgi:hypothetical protein